MLKTIENSIFFSHGLKAMSCLLIVSVFFGSEIGVGWGEGGRAFLHYDIFQKCILCLAYTYQLLVTI